MLTLRLPVAEAYLAAYAPYKDRPVILGIRPEDMYASAAPGGVAVDLSIVAVEALGPETILVAEFPGGAEVSARLDRAFVGQAGSSATPLRRAGADAIVRPANHVEHSASAGRPAARSSISAAPAVAGRHLGRLGVCPGFWRILSIDLKDAPWARF